MVQGLVPDLALDLAPDLAPDLDTGLGHGLGLEWEGTPHPVTPGSRLFPVLLSQPKSTHPLCLGFHLLLAL
ncbi:unnamed protein product, partial [Closterium sp. NIES-54]